MTGPGGESACAIHEGMEPVTKTGTVCFECRHSYSDDQEILDTFREEFPGTKTDSADEVNFCPLCLHDW